MRTILVDDEPGNSEILQEILKLYCPTLQVVGIAENITDALKIINKEEPQLIFLDIQMPNGSGFDLVEQVKGRPINVIFVTAYSQFVLQALRCSAVDYLLKPVNIQEVIAAVKRAQEKLHETMLSSRLDVLLNNIREPAKAQKITIPTPKGYVFIDVFEIERLEANGAYTEVFTNGGKSYLVSKNIREYEEILPPDMFCRIHHSHIVNLNFIKFYHKGRGGYVEMNNGITLEVSSRRKDEFLSRFK